MTNYQVGSVLQEETPLPYQQPSELSPGSDVSATNMLNWLEQDGGGHSLTQSWLNRGQFNESDDQQFSMFTWRVWSKTYVRTLQEAPTGWWALFLAPVPQLEAGVSGGDEGCHAEAVALLGLQVSQHGHTAPTHRLLLHSTTHSVKHTRLRNMITVNTHEGTCKMWSQSLCCYCIITAHYSVFISRASFQHFHFMGILS